MNCNFSCLRNGSELQNRKFKIVAIQVTAFFKCYPKGRVHFAIISRVV